VCQKKFSNSAGTVEITGSVETEKTAHNLSHTAAKQASCTETGNIEYWKCSSCGNYYSDANGSSQIDESDTVIAAGHKLDKIEIAAEKSNSAPVIYWKCSVCGTLFQDANGETETDELTINKAIFMLNQAEQIAIAEALAATGDSEACQKLIADAKATIEAMVYDEKMTAAENLAAAEAIVNTLKEALTTQRTADEAQTNPVSGEGSSVTNPPSGEGSSGSNPTSGEGTGGSSPASGGGSSGNNPASGGDSGTANPSSGGGAGSSNPTSDGTTDADKIAADEAAKKAEAEAAAAAKAAADQTAATAAATAIDGIPETKDMSLKDEETIKAATEAYEGLTEEQKALVPEETVKALEEAQKQVTGLQEKAKEDQSTASAVAEVIDAIPETKDLSLKDTEAVNEAAEAYEGLTDEQKALVPEETVKALEEAQKQVTGLQEKANEDQSTASAVAEAIDAIPETKDLSLRDAETVKTATEAYEGLTDDQKALVPEETVKTLEEAKAQVTVLEEKKEADQNAASEVTKAIGSIPEVKNISLKDTEKVQAAGKAYAGLTEEQKALVPEEIVKALEKATEQVTVLTVARDERAASKVAATIESIPKTDNLTLKNSKKVEKAAKAFEKLTDEQKTLVPETTVATLEDATAQMAILEAEAADPQSLKNVEKGITGTKSDSDPGKSMFHALRTRVTGATTNSLTIVWDSISKADGYIVYAAQCGNKAKLVEVATTKKTRMTLRKIDGVGLKQGTFYKILVVAFRRGEAYDIALHTSKIAHAVTMGGEYTNPKKVQVKAVSIKLKKGKTYTITPSLKLTDKELSLKEHRAISFEASNRAVASVDDKGVITANSKGIAYVYVYAQNGIYARITVNVK